MMRYQILHFFFWFRLDTTAFFNHSFFFVIFIFISFIVAQFYYSPTITRNMNTNNDPNQKTKMFIVQIS